MAQPPYRYEPLDKSKPEIRLLEVVLSNDKSAPIEVKLSKVALKEAISEGFVPFSYVWGDELDPRAITVNGMSRHITRNLATLLHHAREFTIPLLIQMKGKALFWADALCIDQDNIEERTHQITLMRDIYGSAEKVAIWLGVQENAHLAFKVFRTITEQWLEPIHHIGGLANEFDDFDANFGGWMEKYPAFWRKDCEQGMNNSYWNAIKDLLDSPYWDRVWTYQEMVLPKGLFIFASGDSAESMCVFGNMLNMFSWFSKLRVQASGRFPMIDPLLFSLLTSGIYLKIHQIPRIQYALISKLRGKRDDLRFVCFCHGLRASDPRDHVFGLLGLMDTAIVANYLQSTSEVYVGFCSAWLTEIGDLSFLRFAGLTLQYDDSVLQLASWVPDWHYVSKETMGDSKSRVIFSGIHCKEYSASAGLTVDDVKISRPFTQLCLPGIVLEDVLGVTPAWPADFHQFNNSMLQFVKTAMSTEDMGIPAWRLHMFQLLFRTAFLDIYPLNLGEGRLNVSDKMTHTLALKFLFFLLMPSESVSGKSWESVIEEEYPQLGLEAGSGFATQYRKEVFPNAPSVPQLQHWTDAKTALICERDNLTQGIATRLHFIFKGNLARNVKFTTRSGYLGLSNDARPGDKIVVVAGCEVPILLRWEKDNDAFALVGTCFVLGLMDGEAMQRVREGEAKVDVLKIR